MPDSLGSAVLDLTVDTKGFSRGLRSAEGEAKGFTSRTGGMFKSLGKAGLVGGAIAGVGALTAVVKVGIGEFKESTKVAAQTAAVLKSTGGAAGVSAKQVDSLATSIMNYSGIDDEAVKSGENLLLTFTNIRNEVGKGNDIFTQATKTLADMSVSLGQDTKTSAIQLGKALNDPIKGVTALQRVGVSFTAGQKEQIKALVGSGKSMEAQKLILKELNKEFGGSAEAAGKTLPGQLEILKQKFNNFAGDLVAKTIPILQQAIGWLKDHWPEIQAAIQQWWTNVKPILAALGDLIAAVAPIVKKMFDALLPVMRDFAQVIKGVVEVVAALLSGDWSKAWEGAKDIVFGVLNGIKDYLVAVPQLWWAAFGNVFDSVFVQPFQNAWNAVSSWVKEHWVGIVVGMVAGLPILAFKKLYETWGSDFVAKLQTEFGKVGTWISSTVAAWAGFIGALPSRILDFGASLLSRIQTVFSGGAVGGWIVGRVTEWAGFIADLPGKIADFGKSLLEKITGFVTNAGIGTWLSGKVDDFAGFFGGLPDKIASALKDGSQAALGKIKGWFSDLFGWLPGWAKDILGIKSPSTVFTEIGEHIVGGLIKGLGNMAGALKDKAAEVIGTPIDWAKKEIASIAGKLGAGGARGNVNVGFELFQKLSDQGNWGWTGSDWSALVALWNQESGWNQFAKNPSSGAYGIPQALPPTKMPAEAQEAGGSSVTAQIIWGLNYIRQRYGDPDTAWGGYYPRGGWYAKGGIFDRPTIIGVGEAGPEAVVPLSKGLGKPAGDLHVHVHAQTVIGGNLDQVAKDLAQPIRRELIRHSQRNAGHLFA